MILPSSFQSRTGVAFSTNGSLYSLQNSENGIYLATADTGAENLHQITVNSSTQSRRARTGYTLRLSRYKRELISGTSAFQTQDCNITISFNTATGTTITPALAKTLLVQLADFAISNHDSLVV